MKRRLTRPLGRYDWPVPEKGHEVIAGSIGMGKSVLALHKMIRSFYDNLPCALIDPKGDLYWSVLAYFCATEEGRRLWERIKHRVLFLNPVAQGDHLLAFNAVAPLAGFRWSNPDLTALLTNTLTDHIKHQFGFEMGDANRMTNILDGGWAC